ASPRRTGGPSRRRSGCSSTRTHPREADMADSVHIDTSEVRAFAAELGRVAGKALPGLDAVLKKGAQQIKDDLVADAKGSRHFRQIAPTISYDRDAGIGRVGYEIGPDKDRGGAARLGN